MKPSAAKFGFVCVCAVNCERHDKVSLCVCLPQEMKDELSSPSAVAQAEKKSRQVGGRRSAQTLTYASLGVAR